jgi:O-succinylbenzoic acid--CoA ligase
MDWHSNETHILLNPRYSQKEREEYQKSLPNIPGHIWLATSGTSGFTKFVALSKKAILTSAAGVNRHLQSNSSDVWLNPLPEFHVGGLGIKARSFLSGASVVSCEAWEPVHFNEQLHAHKITLTALVPTQLFDLVMKKLQPPTSLRAVIIGGGALDETLYDHAKSLGWPILPSYGLTECSSQVATATTASKQLQLLPHIKVKIEEGFICIQSDALLTTYAKVDERGVTVEDPKVDGWFRTEDRGVLEGNVLKVLGRNSDFVKIGGESVDLLQLDALLNKIKMEMGIADDMVLMAANDTRLGKVIHLMTTEKNDRLVKSFNEQVLPFARIRQVLVKDKIPRTSLGKPIRFTTFFSKGLT